MPLQGLEAAAVFQAEVFGPPIGAGQFVWSTPGVPGFEPEGLYCAVPDGLRLRVAVETSLSHEVRRVGLGSFALVAVVDLF